MSACAMSARGRVVGLVYKGVRCPGSSWSRPPLLPPSRKMPSLLAFQASAVRFNLSVRNMRIVRQSLWQVCSSPPRIDYGERGQSGARMAAAERHSEVLWFAATSPKLFHCTS